MEKPNGENKSMNNVVMLMASPFVLLSLMSICLGGVTVIASKYFYTGPNLLQDLVDSVHIGVWLVLMAVVPVLSVVAGVVSTSLVLVLQSEVDEKVARRVWQLIVVSFVLTGVSFIFACPLLFIGIAFSG
jgi:hypothetical protein